MIKIDPYILGNNVCRHRMRKHMSQMRLAEDADMTIVALSRIENAHTGCHLISAVRIACALGVTVNDLLDGAIVEVDEWFS